MCIVATSPSLRNERKWITSCQNVETSPEGESRSSLVGEDVRDTVELNGPSCCALKVTYTCCTLLSTEVSLTRAVTTATTVSPRAANELNHPGVVPTFVPCSALSDSRYVRVLPSCGLSLHDGQTGGEVEVE